MNGMDLSLPPISAVVAGTVAETVSATVAVMLYVYRVLMQNCRCTVVSQ